MEKFEKIESNDRGSVRVRVRWYYHPVAGANFTDLRRCFCLITMMYRAPIQSKGSVWFILSRATLSLMLLGTMISSVVLSTIHLLEHSNLIE